METGRTSSVPPGSPHSTLIWSSRRALSRRPAGLGKAPQQACLIRPGSQLPSPGAWSAGEQNGATEDKKPARTALPPTGPQVFPDLRIRQDVHAPRKIHLHKQGPPANPEGQSQDLGLSGARERPASLPRPSSLKAFENTPVAVKPGRIFIYKLCIIYKTR